MHIENNVNLNAKNNIKTTDNNIHYYNLKSEQDTVSFGTNVNKPAKGILSKFKEAVLKPFRAIEKAIQQAEFEAKLKKEAEEAAKKTEQAAYEARYIAAESKKLQEAKELSKELLTDWQARYKNLFQVKKYIDNTGDLRVLEPDSLPITSRKIAEPPKKGEYSLANFGINGGYFVKSGYGNLLIRHHNGAIATPLESVRIVLTDGGFADHIWKMKHTYTTSNIDRKLHKCTILSAGFPHSIEQSINRHPGVNFVIEGHISQEDIQQIKKNIVEKGLWENYIEHEDIDAHLGIYNEIINYLNK